MKPVIYCYFVQKVQNATIENGVRFSFLVIHLIYFCFIKNVYSRMLRKKYNTIVRYRISPNPTGWFRISILGNFNKKRMLRYIFFLTWWSIIVPINVGLTYKCILCMVFICCVLFCFSECIFATIADMINMMYLDSLIHTITICFVS